MPTQKVSYALEDGTAVQFEVDVNADWQPVAAGQVVAKVKDAVRPAVTAAKAVLDEVVQLAPADISVKFGVKVSGSANWLVAKASSEGSFEVTLTWHPDRAVPADPDGDPAQTGVGVATAP